METIRVLVVEDSLTIRRRIVEILSADPQCTVIGETEDGAAAIDLCLRLRPDVMTLDMMLPTLSGVAVTEHVMAYCPTPILIVSASLNRGEVYKTYDALAAGAVDVLEKPTGDDANDGWEQRLISTIKIVSRIRVITHPRARLRSNRGVVPTRTTSVDTRHGGAQRSLIAIGASTGGPAALVRLLNDFPADFAVPILLVMHIGAPFALHFAEWLGHQSKLPVRLARDGEPLPRQAPGVLMAPAGVHLIVQNGRLRFVSDPERNSCRPSIDVLFESLARECGPRTTACLLTGMGRDGAQGLLSLRHAGALTFAQDEASCVVFGMPKEAIDIGAVDRVLPIADIASALIVATSSTESKVQS